MKKLVSLFGIVAISIIVITGCSRAENLKLCRIEIADKNQNMVAVLENQSQADVSDLLDEIGWKEIEKPTDKLEKEYIVSVYQRRTKTVIKTDNDDEYIKIMEYVTFENSDVVKVSIGEDLVIGSSANEYLEDYYIASSDFFSKINNVVSTKII